MADFYQSGALATLHQLGEVDLNRLEDRLGRYSIQRPVSLVLASATPPATEDALPHIVDELMSVGYLNRVVVALSGATAAEYEQARDFFSVLPQATAVIWNDGPRLAAIFGRLKQAGLLGESYGKAHNLWISLGYLLACRDSAVIAVHDTDILTYERALLARLVYPLLDPNMEYEFAKGYYARVSDRLHGRVTRLFVTPLLKSLRKVCGRLDFLDYLDAFRYPLAGEYAITAALAGASPMPSHCGLELGILGEVYANCTERRICQVDLSIDYEHHHTELSEDDPGAGLLKMCIDIATTLFSALAAEGLILSDDLLRTLKLSYRRLALDTVRLFEDDAAINGLIFERHAELRTVETFSRGLELATARFLNEPQGAAQLPSWSRVTAAQPGILDEIRAAIEDDNRR